MTLLPTGRPTRPVFQAGMTLLSGNEVGGAPGWAADGQSLLNSFPVRQIEPIYLVTSVCPGFTAGPVPLISVVTTSLAGGPFLGKARFGAWPGVAETVGSAPPPLLTCCPDAVIVAVNTWSGSTTQTMVSVGPTPSWGW